MSKALVHSLFNKSSQTRKLGNRIAPSQLKTQISGLTGSAVAMLIAVIFKVYDLKFLLKFYDKELEA